MATHVAFLRGINVGGHTVTNARLAELVSQLDGVHDVATFQASGNVLLAADEDADLSDLEVRIARHLEERLGWPVPTFVRSASHVTAISQGTPFRPNPEGGKVHVAFLDAPLDGDDQRTVRGFAFDTDTVAFDEREMYWHVGSGRMMESGLGDPKLAAYLGDRWTVRTKATIDRIASRL